MHPGRHRRHRPPDRRGTRSDARRPGSDGRGARTPRRRRCGRARSDRRLRCGRPSTINRTPYTGQGTTVPWPKSQDPPPRRSDGSREFALLELEVGAEGLAVDELHIEPVAARQVLSSLPVVLVLVRRGVIGQLAIRRRRRLDEVRRTGAAGRELHRHRFADQHGKATVATEAELDRDRAARLGDVQRGQVVDRREEPGEGPTNLHHPRSRDAGLVDRVGQGDRG